MAERFSFYKKFFFFSQEGSCQKPLKWMKPLKTENHIYLQNNVLTQFPRGKHLTDLFFFLWQNYKLNNCRNEQVFIAKLH